MIGWLVNNELERMWKKLSCPNLRRNEENIKSWWLGYEPEIFQL
jgi:hypothetical protein